jgi:hypothetical protein
MPPRKTPVRRPTKSAKPAARRSSKSKALAISDPVKREVLSRSMFDTQLALLGAMAAWSPVQMLVGQQAAFWGGFTGPSSSPPAGKRKRNAKSK